MPNPNLAATGSAGSPVGLGTGAAQPAGAGADGAGRRKAPKGPTTRHGNRVDRRWNPRRSDQLSSTWNGPTLLSGPSTACATATREPGRRPLTCRNSPSSSGIAAVRSSAPPANDRSPVPTVSEPGLKSGLSRTEGPLKRWSTDVPIAAHPRTGYGPESVAAQLRSRLSNVHWELRLGIATRGVVPVEHADSTHYATMNYSTIRAILKHLALDPSDVFVDIGSGKGRVLCCAARYPVMQVVGVDMSEAFCQVARRNARRMRGRRAPISVETAAAQDFDYSAATVLFLFDPFGAATLDPLLEQVGRQAQGRVRIAYANPKHDDVFLRQPWLERCGHWDAETAGGEHAVSFYRSR